MPADATRIPICLVTGFLGAGKTTLLRRIASGNHRERRLVFLVNEFSARDMDGALLPAEHPDVVCIPGGSIFCKCLITEFIARLDEIPGRFGMPGGVVIEASGMANPKVMAAMLQETGLDRRYRLATVVSMVDPGSFPKLRHTLPNIVAQVEAADIALISKADCSDAVMIRGVADALRAINARADIRVCAHGDVAFDLFGGVSPSTGRPVFHESPAPCRDPLYGTRDFILCRPLDPGVLRDRLMAVRDDIYRIKGHVRMADGGTVRVDYTATGFSSVTVPSGPVPALVLIHPATPSGAALDFMAWLREAGEPDGA